MTPHVPVSARQWLETQFAGAPIHFNFMRCGTGHRVWLASRAASQWVVRERIVTAPGYVADYLREQTIWERAAASGLAPHLLASLDAGRVWISEWVPQSEGGLSATALGRLHVRIAELGEVSWRLDLRAQLEQYWQQSHRASLCDIRRETGATTPSQHGVPEAVTEAISALEAGPVVLCHNDLLPANVLGMPGRRRVIDWEYAAMGSPYFDAAATLSALPERQHQDYLEAAFPAGWDDALLNAGRRVYEAMEAAWRSAVVTPRVDYQ